MKNWFKIVKQGAKAPSADIKTEIEAMQKKHVGFISESEDVKAEILEAQVSLLNDGTKINATAVKKSTDFLILLRCKIEAVEGVLRELALKLASTERQEMKDRLMEISEEILSLENERVKLTDVFIEHLAKAEACFDLLYNKVGKSLTRFPPFGYSATENSSRLKLNAKVEEFLGDGVPIPVTRRALQEEAHELTRKLAENNYISEAA